MRRRRSSATGRRVTGVVTDHGTIGCDILVNCAGIWAKRVAEMAGVALAAGVVEHQYFVTEKTLTFAADLTTLRDPDKNFYLKPDVGAFAIGGWEDGTQRLLARRGRPSISRASCSRPTWTGWSCSRCRRRSGCRFSTRSASRP